MILAKDVKVGQKLYSIEDDDWVYPIKIIKVVPYNIDKEEDDENDTGIGYQIGNLRKHIFCMKYTNLKFYQTKEEAIDVIVEDINKHIKINNDCIDNLTQKKGVLLWQRRKQ